MKIVENKDPELVCPEEIEIGKCFRWRHGDTCFMRILTNEEEEYFDYRVAAVDLSNGQVRLFSKKEREYYSIEQIEEQGEVYPEEIAIGQCFQYVEDGEYYMRVASISQISANAALHIVVAVELKTGREYRFLKDEKKCRPVNIRGVLEKA